ncbi:hypothetical protein C5167_024853 [Papaver somniferum]|uniref:Uncharacterized protein n=1 Tax=Papaver somniferum TaxID=3469 RepID=A0A4Y7JTR7_PAPSO|nr:hypothetical protein C5167_024853 [Papaver somniferum]
MEVPSENGISLYRNPLFLKQRILLLHGNFSRLLLYRREFEKWKCMSVEERSRFVPEMVDSAYERMLFRDFHVE